MKLLIIIILIYCVKFNYCQNCPYFSYVRNNYGQAGGRIEIGNDFSGYYHIEVNMSVAAYLTNNEKMSVELTSSPSSVVNGDSLVYYVTFPIQNVTPKLTRLEFNQRVYCTGPAEPVRPGIGVTNFWASHSYTTGQSVRRPSNSWPVPNNSNPNFYYTPPPVRENSFENFSPVQSYPSFTQSQPVYTSYQQPTPPPTPRPTPPPAPRRTLPPTLRPTPPPTPRPTPPPTPRPTPPPTPRLAQRPSAGRISENNCGNVSRAIPLIASNDTVYIGQFPWMAGIMYRLSSNAIYNYRCTGNLVSTKHVITAAHCVRLYSATLITSSNMLVVLGKIDIEDWRTGGLSFQVSDVTAHLGYVANTGHNDIAILTLARAVVFTSKVKPICVWEESDDLERVVGQEGTVAGWGSDESGTEVVADAKYVRIPIVSHSVCRNSHRKFENLISNSTFCAGNRDGTGPCNGDSGAGFMMFNNNRWVLRGVVSRNLTDSNICDLRNYFVFSDIAKVTDWLRAVIIRG